MKYLTELHAHTSGVSPCADFTAEEVAEKYISYGYTTLVLTNHYNKKTMDGEASWQERCEFFLSDFYRMKAAAGERLNVLLGLELRFLDSDNDYLVFGATEEFLRTHPDLHHMKLKEFYALSQENGFLFIQAHPFRNGIGIVDPKYVDGYEIFNGHQGHDSRNWAALEWCRHYGKLPTSGSDFHHPYHSGVGGIYTETPVTNMEQLVTVLKERAYSLHCSGDAAKRDGLMDMESF